MKTGAKAPSLFLAAALALAVLFPSGTSSFIAPRPTAAGDIPYPYNNIASGLVTLSLNLDQTGAVQSSQVLRNIGGLTSGAANAASNWSFSPALLKGSPTASTINVEVVFNPGNPVFQPLQVSSPQAPASPVPSGYVPPDVTAASFAAYPINSIGSGAVVLDVHLDNQGNVKKISPIRQIPSLTAPAIAAVKTWTFQPASYLGAPVGSHLVVAIVFRAPIASTP